MTSQYLQAFRLETTVSVEMTSDEADAASNDAAKMVERSKMRVDFMVEIEKLVGCFGWGCRFFDNSRVTRGRRLFGNERVSLLQLLTHIETV
jgi:hypothetical protein